jgi:hypothetical protein
LQLLAKQNLKTTGTLRLQVDAPMNWATVTLRYGVVGNRQKVDPTWAARDDAKTRQSQKCLAFKRKSAKLKKSASISLQDFNKPNSARNCISSADRSP